MAFLLVVISTSGGVSETLSSQCWGRVALVAMAELARSVAVLVMAQKLGGESFSPVGSDRGKPSS